MKTQPGSEKIMSLSSRSRSSLYSLKELSETLGVTEVTILRFTKKIGAQSFVEMKNRLREHLQTRLVHGDGLNRIADHGRDPSGDHDKGKDVPRSSCHEREKCDREAISEISLKDIVSAVAIIRQSRTIYVVGSELVTESSLHDEKTPDIGAGGARSLESEPGSLQ